MKLTDQQQQLALRSVLRQTRNGTRPGSLRLIMRAVRGSAYGLAGATPTEAILAYLASIGAEVSLEPLRLGYRRTRKVVSLNRKPDADKETR